MRHIPAAGYRFHINLYKSIFQVYFLFNHRIFTNESFFIIISTFILENVLSNFVCNKKKNKINYFMINHFRIKFRL